MLNKKHIKELFLITIIHKCTKIFQNRLNKLYLFLGKSYVILHLMIKHYCHCLIATYEYCFKLNFWNLWNSQGEREWYQKTTSQILQTIVLKYVSVIWLNILNWTLSPNELYEIIFFDKIWSNALISDNRIIHKIAWCHENWEFNINTILAQNKQLKYCTLWTLWNKEYLIKKDKKYMIHV